MEGGFNLRICNQLFNLQERINCLECSAVTHKPTRCIPATLEDESYVKRTLGDSQGNLEGFKVLDVHCNPTDDSLVFDIHHRRNIVGITLSRFCESLGILSPITMQFKLMFQYLCMKELNWDDPIIW